MTVQRVKVAIDASSAASGGGITYLREMLPRLNDRADVSVGPILVRGDITEQLSALKHAEGPVVTTESRLGARSRPWLNAVKTDVDVVFVPTEISLGRYSLPVVTMLRNPCFIPEALQEYRRGIRARFIVQQLLAQRSGRTTALAIAVSAYAAHIGLSRLKIPPAKVRVVYHGGPEQQASHVRWEGRRLLVVSNLYRYKNIHRLLGALRKMDDAVTLEIVGRPLEEDYYRELRSLTSSLELDARVIFTGHLDGDALAKAYGRASCLVWPSYAETFGHPLLEASSYGLPIIAADTAVNREIAGDAASYFNPFDVESIRLNIDRAAKERRAPLPLPRTYSWDRCADATAALLGEAARSRFQGSQAESGGRA